MTWLHSGFVRMKGRERNFIHICYSQTRESQVAKVLICSGASWELRILQYLPFYEKWLRKLITICLWVRNDSEYPMITKVYSRTKKLVRKAWKRNDGDYEHESIYRGFDEITVVRSGCGLFNRVNRWVYHQQYWASSLWDHSNWPLYDWWPELSICFCFWIVYFTSIAFEFPAQALLVTPLDTSHASIERALCSALWNGLSIYSDYLFSLPTSDPSRYIPNPPLMTSPHPTPPPLWIDTQVAPLQWGLIKTDSRSPLFVLLLPKTFFVGATFSF